MTYGVLTLVNGKSMVLTDSVLRGHFALCSVWNVDAMRASMIESFKQGVFCQQIHLMYVACSPLRDPGRFHIPTGFHSALSCDDDSYGTYVYLVINGVT